jgi:hypothetical protein|tara:strand:+ start:141 stop:347 length:207 start_codon:yes stop_codon:yes gene_type:complete
MKLISNNGSRALVLYGGKHYVASDNGYETLIFESDAKGNISQYVEVGGGRGATLLDVLGNFSFYLNIF